MTDPCASCPFRLDGIRTTTQNAQRLVTLAMALDADHPCHATVLGGEPERCLGRDRFRQNAHDIANHEGYFSSEPERNDRKRVRRVLARAGVTSSTPPH